MTKPSLPPVSSIGRAGRRRDGRVTAARMIDVLGAKIVEEPVVVITDGRIASVVGRAARGPIIPKVRKGSTCHKTAAGLIDMHVHLDSPADIGGYRGLEYTDSFWAMTAVGNARAMLDAGFTTVRNVGSDNRNDVGLKQAIEGGYATGPRIVPAGFALGATGGHCDSTFAATLERPRKEEGVETGPSSAPQVRRQRKFGEEVIKSAATGGVFATTRRAAQLSEEELRAIADEAHQWGSRSQTKPMARRD